MSLSKKLVNYTMYNSYRQGKQAFCHFWFSYFSAKVVSGCQLFFFFLTMHDHTNERVKFHYALLHLTLMKPMVKTFLLTLKNCSCSNR